MNRAGRQRICTTLETYCRTHLPRPDVHGELQEQLCSNSGGSPKRPCVHTTETSSPRRSSSAGTCRRQFLMCVLAALSSLATTSSTSRSSRSASCRRRRRRTSLKAKIEQKGMAPVGSLMFTEVERRLDVFVFRCCFAHSVYEARRLIIHGYVKLNGRTVRSYALQDE